MSRKRAARAPLNDGGGAWGEHAKVALGDARHADRAFDFATRTPLVSSEPTARSVHTHYCMSSSLTVPPKQSVPAIVSDRSEGARIIVEEASNWGHEPLRAMLRATPYDPSPASNKPAPPVTTATYRGAS